MTATPFRPLLMPGSPGTQRMFLLAMVALAAGWLTRPAWAAQTREQPCAQPWVVGNADGNYVVPGAMGDVVYRTIGGRRLALDAYVPPGRGPHPAVIPESPAAGRCATHTASPKRSRLRC